MESLFTKLNERMIKFVDSRKSLVSKIILGIILFIPIALTFIIAMSSFGKSTTDDEEAKTSIMKDKNKDLYAARDESGTQKVNMGDDTKKKINEMFDEAVGLTGLTITKLDGTAKGGVLFNIASRTHVPIRFIGVGEKIDDLRPFSAKSFVAALFETEK